MVAVALPAMVALVTALALATTTSLADGGYYGITAT